MKSKVWARGDYVFVAPMTRDRSNDKPTAFIIDSLDLNSQGAILYAGPDVPSDLFEGVKVVFNNQYFSVTIEGMDVKVMRADNIVAVLGG